MLLLQYVAIVVQKDAEASGHTLGKGWEERAKGYIAIDVSGSDPFEYLLSCVDILIKIRAGYLLRHPDGHVSVTEKARNLYVERVSSWYLKGFLTETPGLLCFKVLEI